MTSVCIDGFNIAMTRGSGIATYGRNLLTNARAIGLGTQVLYGIPTPLSDHDVLNEAALIEAEAPPRSVNRIEKYVAVRTSSLGRTVHPVTTSGDVIWPTVSGGRPDMDSAWAAQGLFHYARRAWRKHRSLTPVHFVATAEVATPDVMHWTAMLPMYARDRPNIHTFHDLIPLRIPHTTREDKATYMALCQAIVARADHIAVVSETTRQDVIRLLGVPEDRVTNTYQAVNLPADLVDRPESQVVQDLEGVFNLGWKDYLLYFGAVEPKKNLARLLEAYLTSGITTPLVIVGGRSWSDEEETAILDQVKRQGGRGTESIRQLSFVSFPLLVSLIRGARATLFPSLYEGFGLPVLESMALGTAVMTSTAGSLPEVAGDAALSIDPYDVVAMSRALRALDADAGLRDDLVAKGRSQAALFTPEAYQDRLRSLYSKVGIS